MNSSEIYYSEQERQLNNLIELQDKKRIEKLKSDLKLLMSKPEGRRFVSWLLDISQPFADHFNENPVRMARNTGVAYVGAQLHQLITAKCPDLFLQMMNEYNSEQERVRLEREMIKNGDNASARYADYAGLSDGTTRTGE